MLGYLYVYAFWVILPLAAAYAFRRGGNAEREGAVVLTATAIASVSVYLLGGRHDQTNPWLAVIDLLALIAFGRLAVRSDRWWPMCMTVLQAMGVLSHFAKMLNPDLRGLGYQLMAQSASYPLVLTLIYATWSYSRRQAIPANSTFPSSSESAGSR